MATGYTSVIRERDDVSFNEFVWRCARAFGSLIMMRDESLDDPVDLAKANSIASSYHAKALKEAYKRLAEAASMTLDEAARLEQEQYDESVLNRDKCVKQNKELRSRYQEMLDKVNLWNVPSPAHAGLKDFMLQQLKESIEHDCSYVPSLPERLTPEKFKLELTERFTHDIAYHSRDLERDKLRDDERREWLKALVESVGEPHQNAK